MKKIEKHIEIVRSTNLKLSSLSSESCEAILKVLRANYERVGISIVNNLADLKKLTIKHPDLVFMGVKYVLGEGSKKIWISSYLDRYQIEHTGSGRKAIELEFNKPRAKQKILNAGLKTSAFEVLKNGELLSNKDSILNFPLFVKPTNLGGGQGIDEYSVVHNQLSLQKKTKYISDNFSVEMLIEEYLPGREFSVAIIKDEFSDDLIAMPIELVAKRNKKGDRILSKKVKSSNEETVLMLSETIIKARVIDMAIEVFKALGARDYGRIDIRLDKNNDPHFLEANLIPSLIKGYGSFPKACLLNMGIDYEAMILSITRLGFARTLEPSKANNLIEQSITTLVAA